MSYLRLRVKIQKDKRGVSLEKLEKIVSETRKFLVAIGEDLELGDPSTWVGVDFRNGSLSFTNESSSNANQSQLSRFNESVIALGRSEFPAATRESTANQFFKVAASLDVDEAVQFGVFPVDKPRPKWITITRKTALLAEPQGLLPYRETLGSVQGTIHSLYKESREPFFYMRELSTESLVKCFYDPQDYALIVEALEIKTQVIHVRGVVMSNTQDKSIKHISVNNIVRAKTFDFEDVEKFLHASRPQ